MKKRNSASVLLGWLYIAVSLVWIFDAERVLLGLLWLVAGITELIVGYRQR